MHQGDLRSGTSLWRAIGPPPVEECEGLAPVPEIGELQDLLALAAVPRQPGPDHLPFTRGPPVLVYTIHP